MRALSWMTILAFLGSVACDRVDLADVCASAGGSVEERALRSRSSNASTVAVFARSSGEGYLCSGVVVGPQAVLTAAHCVQGREDWSSEVYFATDLQSEGRSIRVESAREHPDRDLALLLLSEAAPGQATPLRWSGDRPGSQHTPSSTATGYGGPEGDVSRCLRLTEPARDLALDPSDPGRLAVLLDGNAYFGDSGGPLVFEGGAEPLLLGVQSRFTGTDVSYGTLSYFERLLDDDPWVLEALPTPPVRLP